MKELVEVLIMIQLLKIHKLRIIVGTKNNFAGVYDNICYQP